MSLRISIRRLILFCVLSFLAMPQRASAQTAPAENATAPRVTRVPEGVILIKGAEASAIGVPTPVPEGGGVAKDVYRNPYFALSYQLPEDWIEKYKGPPPSDHGNYVLAQLRTASTFKGADRGSILITAQDLFFAFTPMRSAMDLIKTTRETLPPYYEVERSPAEVKIGDHSFARFDYMSPVAQLHWYVLATEIRCHAVEFVFTSRDTRLLDRLVGDLSRLELPGQSVAGSGGDGMPVCVRDYAEGPNLINSVDAVLPAGKFNPIPVRVIIGTDGKVKHIHFISAFPDQARSVSEALLQWRFKPHEHNGQPVEVETGILFGAARPAQGAAKTSHQVVQ